MATVPHCLFCFESLSASLEHRKPPSLAQVEADWIRYRREQLLDGSLPYGSASEATIGSTDQSDSEDGDTYAPGSEQLDHLDISIRRSKIQNIDAGSEVPSQKSHADPSSRSPASSSPSSSSPSTGSKASSLRTDSPASKSSSRSSLSLPAQQPTNLDSGRSTDSDRYPMFITWNVVSKNNARTLRGCIGTFENQLLEEGLGTYALTSAFEDVRFSPVSASEIPSLECGVTLLTNFEPAPTPMSWEIGKHGLRIAFTYHSKRYGATYLPDVAREQGWTKTETLISLMRKAGWSGRRDEWQNVGDLSIVRYQGCRASTTYETWKGWRDWVNETR